MMAVMCAISLLAQANDLTCPVPAPPLTLAYDGYLSGYAPGVMAEVIGNRQSGAAAPGLPARLPHVDGYAAVLHCEHVGRLATLRRGEREATVLITDCAHPDSYGWMLGGPFAAEVDAGMWADWGPGWISVEVEE